MQTVLSLRHLLLALAVVAVWGTNFVVIKLALHTLPPLLFGTLRFALAAFPAMLFIRRPAVPWTQLAAYGLLIGVGQFGLLFIAMQHSISPGLASLVVQSQVFFTILLVAVVKGERPRWFQLLATAVAAAGIVTIAAHTDGSTTVGGLLLVVLAALCWGWGNVVSRSAGQVNMLAYMVWSSAFAVLPLLALSLWFEGPARIAAGLHAATWQTWLEVLYQSYGNTLFGYGAWAWLLSRYAAASVTPTALLVPVFGMGTAALAMSEALPPWKIAAAALVLTGLVINVAWPRLERRLRRG